MSTTTSDQPDVRVRAALDAGGTPHRVIRHDDLAGLVRSAMDVARLLPFDQDRITKTMLITDQGSRPEFALVVVQVMRKVRFPAAAGLLGWRRASLASTDEVEDQLDQPVYGVSPIGHEGIPVVIDSSLAGAAPVLVGSGVRGIEIEIGPLALADVIGATWGPVAGP